MHLLEEIRNLSHYVGIDPVVNVALVPVICLKRLSRSHKAAQDGDLAYLGTQVRLNQSSAVRTSEALQYAAISRYSELTIWSSPEVTVLLIHVGYRQPDSLDSESAERSQSRLLRRSGASVSTPNEAFSAHFAVFREEKHSIRRAVISVDYGCSDRNASRRAYADPVR